MKQKSPGLSPTARRKVLLIAFLATVETFLINQHSQLAYSKSIHIRYLILTYKRIERCFHITSFYLVST